MAFNRSSMSALGTRIGGCPRCGLLSTGPRLAGSRASGDRQIARRLGEHRGLITRIRARMGVSQRRRTTTKPGVPEWAKRLLAALKSTARTPAPPPPPAGPARAAAGEGPPPPPTHHPPTGAHTNEKPRGGKECR
jgi:hypothetical protein